MQLKIPKRLDTLSKAFQARRTQDLKRIGNDNIKEAVLESDSKLAKMAVISYSLYKILSKDHFLRSKRWPKVSESIVNSISKSIQAIEKNNEKAFNKHLDNAIDEIQFIDNELSNYARNIYEKSKIKQASTAYALGMSLSNAAALTGADRKELQLYIGATRIHDEQKVKKGISERLKTLKELLE